ncbi:MAG: SRPBCC family protein [Albidovulum sp.]|nr:SRPBCC family protein [Albidovulum sp.]
MKYELEICISAPRPSVAKLFIDQSRLAEWQPSLRDLNWLQGSPGEAGAKCELTHKIGKRTVVMTETVRESNLPARISYVYEAKGVWNPVDNHFEEISPDETRWRFKTEFQCKGVMRIMSLLMPGAFKKESRRHMQEFKAFAEREAAKEAIVQT